MSSAQQVSDTSGQDLFKAVLDGRTAETEGRDTLDAIVQETHRAWTISEAKLEAEKQRHAAIVRGRDNLVQEIERERAAILQAMPDVVAATIAEAVEGQGFTFKAAEDVHRNEFCLRWLTAAEPEINKLAWAAQWEEITRGEYEVENAKANYADARAEKLSFDLLMDHLPAIRRNGGMLTVDLNTGDVGGLRECAKLARWKALDFYKTLNEIESGKRQRGEK